jgi:hypothetical protein
MTLIIIIVSLFKSHVLFLIFCYIFVCKFYMISKVDPLLFPSFDCINSTERLKRMGEKCSVKK